MHNRKREESIALAYHPCAKFSGGQVGANMSESACGHPRCASASPVYFKHARACGLALVRKVVNRCQGWHTAHIQSATLSSLSLLCTLDLTDYCPCTSIIVDKKRYFQLSTKIHPSTIHVSKSEQAISTCPFHISQHRPSYPKYLYLASFELVMFKLNLILLHSLTIANFCIKCLFVLIVAMSDQILNLKKTVYYHDHLIVCSFTVL